MNRGIGNQDNSLIGVGISPAPVAMMGIVLLTLFSGLASATPVQDQASLQASAQAFLEDQLKNHPQGDVEVELGRLDSRLRLTACTSPLDAFLPAGAKLQGKLTVGIRCTSEKPWTVYLPAQIRIYKEIIAAARPIKRGTSITGDDITRVRQEVSSLRSGYFEETDHVIGKLAARTMNSGQVFTISKLKTPLLIRRGENVTILAASGNLEVRSRGKALKDAVKGELLTVRNTRSKRIIQVIAVDTGTVRVNL